jgi:hypothetical protein
MNPREWRLLRSWTLKRTGIELGALLGGPPVQLRTLQRYEIGIYQIPTHIAEAMWRLSRGAVTPNDFHAVRVEYLRERGEMMEMRPLAAAE